MKSRKRLMSLILCIIMVITLMPAGTVLSFADSKSGTCGDNITWKITGNAGAEVLEMSGSGAIAGSFDIGSFNNTVKEIKIGSDITAIKNSCFVDMTGVEKLTFGDNSRLRFIGKEAFRNLPLLKEIILPDSLEFIDENAFSACTALKKISFGSKIRKISSNAFEATAPETIIVSSKNPYLTAADNVLYNKDKTELIYYPAGKKDSSFSVPATVKLIGDFSFSDNKYLETVNIPASVEEIGAFAFSTYADKSAEDYKGLKEINFAKNSKLKTINGSAFKNTDITSITLPASVETLGYKMFYNCRKLKSVDTEKNSRLTDIGRAFDFCPHFESFTLNGGKDLNPTSIGGIDADNIYLGEARNIEDIAISSAKNLSFSPENEAYITAEDGSIYTADKKNLIRVFPHKCPEELIVPEGVEEIKDMALYGCTALKKITLPSTLEIIGSAAFEGAAGLTAVNIPDSVKEILPRAFFNCSSLKTVAFGKNSKLESISYSAFEASALESFTVPAGVKELSHECFKNCKKLKSLSLANPGGMYNFNAYDLPVSGAAFAENISPDGICYLGDYALFYKGTGDTIKIKDGTKYIADMFGGYNDTVKKLIIPASVERIENSAFSGLSGLTEVVFEGESRLEYLGRSAFGSRSNLLTADENGMLGHVIISYDDSKNRDLYVKGRDFIIPEGVTSVANLNYAGIFREVKDADRLVIPSTMKSLCTYAFTECSYKEVCFAENSSLEMVENNVFVSCNELTELMLPASVKYNSGCPFGECASLKKFGVEDPSDIEVFPSLPYDEYSLNSVFIPSGVEYLQYINALEEIKVSPENESYTAVNDVLFTKDMKTLIKYPEKRAEKEYKIPDGVEYIEEEAFYNVKGTEKIIFPDSVKEIGCSAFENSVINELCFGKNSGLKSIYGNAFAGTELDVINLPASLKYLDTDALIFNKRSEKPAPVSAINVAEGNKYFTSENGVLYNKDKTELIKYPPFKKETEFTVPEGVKTILPHAFAFSQTLMRVKIADSVEEIGSDAFYECRSLYEAEISESSVLRTIGTSAFANTVKLSSIYLPLTVKRIESSALAGVKYIRYDCPANPYVGSAVLPWSTFIVEKNSISEQNIKNVNWDESKIKYVPEDEEFTLAAEIVLPTCKKDGSTARYKSSRDGREYADPWGINPAGRIPAAGHLPGLKKGALYKEADCENPGLYYLSCVLCGETVEDEAFSYCGATKHTAVKKADAKYLKSAPTCLSAAEYFQSCKDCGLTLYGEKTFSDGILGTHKFDKKDTDKKYLKAPATCTKAAEYYYSCAYCGQKGEKTFTYGEPSPHTFDKKVRNEKTLKSPETASSGAVYYYSCSVCGAISPDKTFTDPISYKQGDADKDGKITAADARLALRSSVGLEKFDSVQLKASDVDKDGKITAADARIILRVSVGLEKFS